MKDTWPICPDCGQAIEPQEAPVWYDIKIPFTGITLVIGRWKYIDGGCPECNSIKQEDRIQDAINSAGEEAYWEGHRDGQRERG